MISESDAIELVFGLHWEKGIFPQVRFHPHTFDRKNSTRSGKAFRLVNSFSARAQSSRLKKNKNGKMGKNENLRKFQKMAKASYFDNY